MFLFNREWLHLKGTPPLFTLGDNFGNFLLSFLYSRDLESRVYCNREKLAGANHFLYEITLIEKIGKTFLTELPPHKLSILLKQDWKVSYNIEQFIL